MRNGELSKVPGSEISPYAPGEIAEAPRPGHRLDTSVPSPARMYGYVLGGKDHWPADREAAGQIAQMPKAARDNREFLRRAVAWAAGEGLGQFLDIGCGMPLWGHNTHEVVRDARPQDAPAARVAYVDSDRMAVTHAVALLAQDREVTGAYGDLREPEGIWGSPELEGSIDPAEPVAVILGAVLHFLPGQYAYAAVDYLKTVMMPGSVLIISHATADDADPGETAKVEGIYQAAGNPLFLRARDDVERFFAGLDLAAPGVVDVTAWRPVAAPVAADPAGGAGQPPAPVQSQTIGYGGAAVKPLTAAREGRAQMGPWPDPANPAGGSS